MRPALVLASRAHAMLEADCRAHPRIETGGLLVGRSLEGAFVVPFVVPAGPRAARSAGGFAPDSDFQQAHLDFLFTRFGLNYLGDYHSHPAHFARPSTHDLKTARHIVTDPGWNTPEALFPIVVVRSGRVLLRAFLMRREAEAFEELPVEIVPDRDRRIRRLLVSPNPVRKEEDHGFCPSCGRGGGPRRRGFLRFFARLRPRARG